MQAIDPLRYVFLRKTELLVEFIEFSSLNRSKMSKNLDKLKQFFRSNKASGGQDRVQVLNTEIERELRKDNTTEKRIKLMKDLGEIFVTNRIEEVFRAY